MKDINLYKTKNSWYFKKIHKKTELSPNDTCDGYLIDAPEKEARRIIDSLKNSRKKIAVLGGDNHYNRRILETMNIHYLVSPERGTKKDTLKQRDSGLNHVLAKIANKKDITIIIDMQDLTTLQGKEKAKRIARIIQNIKICRKTKTKIIIASMTKKSDEILDELQRKAFATSIGMSDAQTKKCTQME